MSEETVTVYQFCLADNATEQDFLAASAKSDAFLKQQPGFRYRSLNKLDSDTWLDIVYWANTDSAAQANTAFEQDKDCKRFLSMLNMETVKMQSAKIVSQVMG